MKEYKQIFIQLADGDICKCSLEISQSEPWQICLSGVGYKRVKFTGEDLFQALLAMREELEKSSCKILCNGARKDVLPSGMSRGMSGGRKAYVIRKGCPARMKDILDIFDFAEPRAVSTCAEQQRYHEEWVESLNEQV